MLCIGSRLFTKSMITFGVFVLAAVGGAEQFRRSEVKLVGPIQYGEPTAQVQYTGHPRFFAFDFNGRPGEQLEITIHGGPGKLMGYVTDARFRSLAGGNAHFKATIPADSQPSTYYVLVGESNGRPAKFTVDVERP